MRAVSIFFLWAAIQNAGFCQYPYVLYGHVVNSDGSVPANGDIRITTYNKTLQYAIDTTYNGGYEHTFWASNIGLSEFYWFNWGDTINVRMENINPNSPYFGEFQEQTYVPQNQKVAMVEIGETVTSVDLVSFYAYVKKNDVILTCCTPDQSGYLEYNVERSEDGENFKKISTTTVQKNDDGTTGCFEYIEKDVPLGIHHYRINKNAVGNSSPYSYVITVNVEAPKKFELSNNYPNPFNASTTIEYETPKPAIVHFNIYNVLGQRICQIEQVQLNAGYFKFTWDGKNDHGGSAASGIYVILMNSSDFRAVKKACLLK